jgi:hypothetical protein
MLITCDFHRVNPELNDETLRFAQGDKVNSSDIMISLFSSITIYISKVVIAVGHVHMLKNRVRQGNKTIFSVHKRSHKSVRFFTDVSY